MSNKDICSKSRRGLIFLRKKLRILNMILTISILAVTVLCMPGSYLTVHADSGPISVTCPVYHHHSGDSENGGGCYSNYQSYTRTIEIPCGGTLYYWGDAWGTSECDRCGASYFGNRGGESCPHSEYGEETVYYYELGCGHSQNEVVGYVTYTRDTTDWTKQVTATISYRNLGMSVASNPYSMNGTRNSSGVFTITENGNYRFTLIADSNSSVTSHTMNIRNIDHTGPTVVGYSLDPSDWTTGDVTVTLDNVTDLQPDGSEGCGLCEEPYSFDGGQTWTTVTSHTYSSNGTHSILIKDALGNITDYPLTVGNIDREPPRIVRFDYDHTPNVRTVEIEVECDDVLEDGRNGAGLDDLPYSYDGGVTWTDETTLEIDSNQVIEFRVRDKLGNTASFDETIGNIDNYAPTVTYVIRPDRWTNQDVDVIFSVTDINGDGSEGIGLPENFISYDGGRSWTSNTTVHRKSNGVITLSVRDLNDNSAPFTMTVSNIDKNPPSINITCNMADDNESAVLYADIYDGESGVDEGSIEWSGPSGGGGTTLEISENGTYTVRCRDIAGNESYASIEVSDIDDGDDDDDVTRIKPTPAPTPKIVPNIRPLRPSSAGDTSGDAQVPDIIEEEEDVIIPESKTDPKPVKLKRINDNKNKSLRDRFMEWWDNLATWQKILFILLILLLLFGLFLLFMLWYRSVGIHNSTGEKASDDSDEEKYILMAYKLIHTSDGHFTVEVPESVWNRSATTAFKFTFNPLFVFFHRDEEICISFPEDVVRTEHIDCKIYILVR